MTIAFEAGNIEEALLCPNCGAQWLHHAGS
jgi:hypothetical protein